MGVRVWGMVEDRLVQVRFARAAKDAGIRIVGLPADRARTTTDRVRAALINSGLVLEAPSVSIYLEPAVGAAATSDLDLAVALASLAAIGRIGSGLRWVLATGRLGLAGTVHARGHSQRVALNEAVESLCHTPVVGFEQMFEQEIP